MQMQNLKHITNLTVGKANYRLNDNAGNILELMVDYENNMFEIKNNSVSQDSDFFTETTKFATGLLAREHGVNLAKREHYL